MALPQTDDDPKSLCLYINEQAPTGGLFEGDRDNLSPEEYQKIVDGKNIFDFTPDNPPKPFDLRAQVLKLVEKAENKRTKGLKDGDSVPATMIEALKAAAA